MLYAGSRAGCLLHHLHQLPGFAIHGVKLPTKEVCLGGSRGEPPPAAPSAQPCKERIRLKSVGAGLAL